MSSSPLKFTIFSCQWPDKPLARTKALLACHKGKSAFICSTFDDRSGIGGSGGELQAVMRMASDNRSDFFNFYPLSTSEHIAFKILKELCSVNRFKINISNLANVAVYIDAHDDIQTAEN